MLLGEDLYDMFPDTPNWVINSLIVIIGGGILALIGFVAFIILTAI